MNTQVLSTLDDCMTVEDLIAELSALPPDTPVVFACDYGDICHTQQALPASQLTVRKASDLHESGYSHSGVALADEYDEEDKGYCAKCDEVWSITTKCPKCSGQLVDEAGEPFCTEDDEDDDEVTQVVVLS